MKLLSLLLACGLASSAFAQAPGQTPPIKKDKQAQRETKRERVKKRIRALRAYTLTEELGLNEQDASKLFPLLAKYDDDFDRLLLERQQLQQQLDAAGDSKDKGAINKVIDQSIANQRATWDTEDKRLVEIRKILTPAQVARMLIVLPALERRIQNQLRNAVKAKPGQGANKKPPPDLDDLDDDVEPSETPTPAPQKKPAGAKNPGATPNQPCDPFSSRHGC